MTIQKAIDHINYDRQEDIPKEALEMAITALERQREYGWHDLRKDPSDMPATEDTLLLLYHSNRALSIGLKYGKDCFATLYTTTAENASIIAWKYIEPFEVEA